MPPGSSGLKTGRHMKIWDSLTVSYRMITANRLRAVLTSLGIGVAVGLIVFLVGLGYGLQELTVGSILHSKNLLSLDVTVPPESAAPITGETVATIGKLAGADGASPVTSMSGDVRLNGKVAAGAVEAMKAEYVSVAGAEVSRGILYRDGRNEVLLSTQILDLLEMNGTEVLGREVTLRYNDPADGQLKTVEKAVVVGITDEADSATIRVPYEYLSNQGERPLKLTGVKALAKDRDAVISMRDSLVKQGYQVETLFETLDQARAVFRWVTIALAVIGLIAVAVAAIGMFNTMTIALMERTRDYGIMKTVGVYDGDIRRLFLTEAAVLGFLGGLAGLAIGLGAEVLVSWLLNVVFTRFGGEALHLFLHPAYFLPAMLLFPVILSIVTGVYPALRASRLSALQALRYE